MFWSAILGAPTFVYFTIGASIYRITKTALMIAAVILGVGVAVYLVTVPYDENYEWANQIRGVGMVVSSVGLIGMVGAAVGAVIHAIGKVFGRK